MRRGRRRPGRAGSGGRRHRLPRPQVGGPRARPPRRARLGDRRGRGHHGRRAGGGQRRRRPAGARRACGCRSRRWPGSRRPTAPDEHDDRGGRHRRPAHRRWSATSPPSPATTGWPGRWTRPTPRATATRSVVAATGHHRARRGGAVVRSLAAYAVEARRARRPRQGGGRGTRGSGRVKTDWNPVLRPELAKPYWGELQSFVAAERAAGPGVPAARRGVRLPAPHALRRHPGADPRPGPVPRAGARPTACASRCAGASPSRRRW